MGYKTGQSASLLEAAEREFSITLPSPTPLGSLAPMVQVRHATLGYRTSDAGTSSETGTPEGCSSAPSHNEGASDLRPAVVTSVSHLKSIGSKSVKKKAPSVPASDIVHVENATAVLEEITFDIEQGAKIAIVGKNGAGKS